MSTQSREVRLAELMASLSLATDLGMSQPLEQALRYCLLALELARRVGTDAKTASDVYYLALVEHLGCTATAPEIASWNGGDELRFRTRGISLTHASMSEFLRFAVSHVGEGRTTVERARLVAGNVVAGNTRAKHMAAIQCESAVRLAERLGLTEGVREGLNHVYERWDGKGMPGSVAGEQLSAAQRIVIVAHDAVVLERLGGRPAALEQIRGRRGTAYDPDVCDALLSDGESLLGGEASEGDAWALVLDAEPEPRRVVRDGELDRVAAAFADFTDLKAPFLMGHSGGVAELAVAAAGSLGVADEDATALRRAALLHDLGRLGVADDVWSEPGPLSSSQRERVRLHPYFTERILARASIFAPLAGWAASHHERLDGSGYHRGVVARDLPLEARVLAAADVYDAMTHERPYRPALTAERTREELRGEVADGRLDQRAVNAVLEAAGERPFRARDAWPAGLTDREVEVLRLVARGKTNRQIAAQLVIAEKTVGRHVENIYGKAGLSTRAGAALFASEHDLLD